VAAISSALSERFAGFQSCHAKNRIINFRGARGLLGKADIRRLIMQENNPYAAPSSNLSGGDSFGEQGGGVTQGVIAELSGTRGWTQFMAILAFLIAGAALLFSTMGAGAIDQLFGALNMPFGKSTASTVVLIIGGVVAVIAATYGALLSGFSSAVSRLQRSGSESDLAAALDKQRAFWVFWGILAVIGIILNFIGLVR
jgi:hypothetical protein